MKHLQQCTEKNYENQWPIFKNRIKLYTLVILVKILSKNCLVAVVKEMTETDIIMQ